MESIEKELLHNIHFQPSSTQKLIVNLATN